jgi:hypothetical protein
MPYTTTIFIAEHRTEAAAQAARDHVAAQFPEMAGRLTTEETSEPWILRDSWSVALQNGTNAECSQLWEFIYNKKEAA